jgi:hypothetical protein
MKTPEAKAPLKPLAKAQSSPHLTRLKTIACAAITLSLLAAQNASALLVQPYWEENKLRMYAGMFPETPGNPVREINLAPAMQAAWGSTASGPNAVLCHGNKMFVSFDIGFSMGGVLVYNQSDVYPTHNGNLPSVIKPAGGNGLVCFGMAVDPVSGDLYVGTYYGGVRSYTAASGYSPASESIHAGFNSIGGAVKAVCANLAFDSSGNLWFTTWDGNSDSPANHLLICLKNNNPALAYTLRSTLNNGGPAYTATIRSGGTKPVHLFSGPEGVTFDSSGNLWFGNNNDNTYFQMPNDPGDGTFCKISQAWIYGTMLANVPGNYPVPAIHTEVKLISGSQFGGLTWLGGQVGLLLHDQDLAEDPKHALVWRFQTGVAFNEQSCFSSGINTTHPGNGSMGLFNENSVLPMPPVTDLAYTMTTTGSYTRGATAKFQITITNVGTHAIPFGMSQHCGCQTVFGPSPPNPIPVTPDSFSGTGWFGTVIDGIPVARHFGGLAPGQSYPPLTFTFRISDNVNATSVFVAAEGYGPNEIEVGDNLTWQSVSTVPPNEIERFRLEHFGDAHPVGDAADNAAPAADGIPNLLKFALDLDPHVPAVMQDRVADAVEGGQLVFDIARNPDAVGAGLVYVVEQTTNLADPNSWTSNGVTVNINTPSRLKATLSQPALPGAAFMRLKVLAP